MRNNELLFDQKWLKFLKRSRLFRHIPFIDFVLAAGSMALGNVTPDSDFDAIVGARSGRIFTVRFFCILVFGFFGWRRKKIGHKEAAADKICLNHFVTEESYRLSPPYDDYWRALYFNLVPIFGNSEKIRLFWKANEDWLGKKRLYNDDLRHKYRDSSLIKRILESLLNGKLGDCLEKALKKIQIKKIERSLKTDPPSYKPRIKYNDQELEFHPDTKRIQNFLQADNIFKH